MNAVARESDTAEGALDLVSAWAIVWAYKYLIIGVALVFGVVAAIIALTTTPVYRAEVIVTQVSSNGLGAVSGLASQLGGIASLAGVNLGTGDGADPQRQAVLVSRGLATEFVNRGGLAAVLLAKSKSTPTLWSAVERFREGVLHVREDKLKGTTTVAIEWTDAGVAAEWANRYVALANEVLRKRAVSDASRNIAYLNEQLGKTTVVEMRRALYNLIENETKTLMLANARQEYAFSIVDLAVKPELRVRPKRTMMVLVGLVLGGLLGLVVAFVRNLFARNLASGG